jgi:hypothetical protein
VSGVEIELKFEVTGQASLDAEFRGFQALLADGMKKSLLEVNAKMQEALKEHIEQDVYYAYVPRVYERRSLNPGFGTPLSDLQANVGFSVTEVQMHEKGVGGQTRFQYKPTGQHANSVWSGTDGDALIGRLENKSPAYRWGNRKVPERPFWQNFVDEMVDGGKAEDFFVDGMNFYAPQLEVEAGGGVERESGDGDY